MKPLYSRFSRMQLTVVLVITLNISVKAQTFTTAGDIAFTGYIAADPGNIESFSFVVLKNISAGSTLNFTDYGWTGTAFQSTATESVCTWTTLGSTIPAGREVKVSGLANSATMTVTFSGNNSSAGTMSGTMVSLLTSGDQVLAYVGAFASPTFIAGIHMNSYNGPGAPGFECGNTTAAAWDPPACASPGNGNSSAMPTGLTGGTTALFIGVDNTFNSDFDNAKFIGCGVPLSTPAQVRAAINTYNSANWDEQSGAPTFTLPSNCTFLGLAPLPVNITSFTGKLNSDKTVTLQWKVEAQQDMQEYIVEESTDGSTYRQLGSVAAGTGNTDTYSYTDMQVATGNNYYRLKTVELSGKIAYSDVVVVNLKSGIKVSVYPNPVADKLTIQQFGTIQNKTAVLLDGEGKTLQQIKLTNLQQDVSVKGYPAGIYIVKMEDGTVFKIVKQ